MCEMTPSPPIDSMWAPVLAWRIRGKVIRIALYCVVYDSLHNGMHTHVSSSYIFACLLGLDLYLCVYLRFVFCMFFQVSLGYFVLVLLAFVVLGLVSSVLSQEIFWEERLRNDLFCVQWDVKLSINQSSMCEMKMCVTYYPARHRGAEGLIFYCCCFFFFFWRLISEVTEWISIKLGHIFTYDCCWKIFSQLPWHLPPWAEGQKTAFWDRLWTLTEHISVKEHVVNNRREACQSKGTPLNDPVIWWTLVRKQLRKVGEFLPTP